MTTTPNPNDLSAAVDYAASSPEDKFSNSRAFEETVLKIRDTIVNARFGEPVRSKIEAVVKTHLPSMNQEYAVELCYKIAGVEPPEEDGFSLPALKIEETIPAKGFFSIAEIGSSMLEYLKRFIVADENSYLLLVYYAMLTWFCPALHVIPYLFVYSGAPASGKTTVALTTAHLCYRPCIVSSSSTTAALSRACARRPCTLMIDEIDSATPALMQEITAILNAGSSGSGDVSRIIVDRSVHGKERLAALRSFGPKILVGLSGPNGLQRLQPATASRCICINLEGTNGVIIAERLPKISEDDDAAILRQKLATIAENYAGKFKQKLAKIHDLDPLPSRTRDKYLPLIALSSLVDAERPPTTRTDTSRLMQFIKDSYVPEEDIGRFILQACGKILIETIAPALKECQSSSRKKHIQGMQLVPASELSRPFVCKLRHEPVKIVGCPAGTTVIREICIAQSGGKLYVSAKELLAGILMDPSSPLQTASSGRPLTYIDFCKYLKTFKCDLCRLAVARNVLSIDALCAAMTNWLDTFKSDPVLNNYLQT